MQEMLNKNNIFDMRTFLVDILRYTLFFEGLGVVILAIRLMPEFGIWQGFFCPVLLRCPCAWSEPGTAAYNGLTALCRLAAHQYNGRH